MKWILLVLGAFLIAVAVISGRGLWGDLHMMGMTPQPRAFLILLLPASFGSVGCIAVLMSVYWKRALPKSK